MGPQFGQFGSQALTLGISLGGHPHNVVLQSRDLGGELFAVKSRLGFDRVEGFRTLLQNLDFMMEARDVIGNLIAIETAHLRFEFRNF
ncbi:hypothetical protein [Mycolicibacter terrae]|uniref:hypothetical protein n=1 Tax=Mycolicibacter terrae TaxID=1788 RepID=UPI001F2BEA92|nr:hypothetical protein [Mycolicibacter terrae]